MQPLPSHRDAERAMIGAILIDNRVLARVGAELQVSHFYHDPYREMYSAMQELGGTVGEVNFLLLRDILAKRGKLELCGGVAAITQTTDRVPDIAGIEKIADIIREKSVLRRIVAACQTATTAALNQGDSTEIAAKLSAELTSLATPEDRRARPLYQVVAEVRRADDERIASGRSMAVTTGFPTLDDMTLGIPKEALTIIAAPTSVGKTAFGLNVLLNAVEMGSRVALYSLEMSDKAISDRIRARMANVFLGKIRDWRIVKGSPRYMEMVDEAERRIRQYGERVVVTSRLSSINEIIADCRRLHSEHGLDLVIVDYLQIVQPPPSENVKRQETREREVNQMAWSLDRMAKDIGCAAVALSQVVPGAQLRKDGRLSVEDVRDAKAITHHARMTLMVNRPWQINKGANFAPCHTILQVEKASESSVGDIELHFNGAIQEFTEGGCRNGCFHFGK